MGRPRAREGRTCLGRPSSPASRPPFPFFPFSLNQLSIVPNSEQEEWSGGRAVVVVVMVKVQGGSQLPGETEGEATGLASHTHRGHTHSLTVLGCGAHANQGKPTCRKISASWCPGLAGETFPPITPLLQSSP